MYGNGFPAISTTFVKRTVLLISQRNLLPGTRRTADCYGCKVSGNDLKATSGSTGLTLIPTDTHSFHGSHPSGTRVVFVVVIVQHTRFVPAPEYLAKLQQAIQQAHGCASDYESTWMGVEHCGAEFWSGSVEIFRLEQPAPAERAYAWSKVEGGQLHCYLVLEQDGVDSPRKAVRHALAIAQSAPELQVAC